MVAWPQQAFSLCRWVSMAEELLLLRLLACQAPVPAVRTEVGPTGLPRRRKLHRCTQTSTFTPPHPRLPENHLAGSIQGCACLPRPSPCTNSRGGAGEEAPWAAAVSRWEEAHGG